MNYDFRPGDFMLIKDQISSFVPSPLIGENIDELGARFPDMSEIYDISLRKVIKKTAAELDIDLKEGTYLQFTGPAYETPAEIRMARVLGADVVGVPLGETASHQQLFQPPGLFQFRQLQNIFDGFALGGLNEAAGVQHRHVGPVRVAGNSVPRPAAQGHHLLGVHQILGTAEGNKCDFIWHHHRSNILV